MRERLRICAYVDHDRGGWAVRTRVELVFAFDAISATSSEGRPANAAPCEVQMDACTFGRDDQASSSRRRRRRNGVSGAARKAANGVARGANTPLAVEKQSGDRSGDRPSPALMREAGLGGDEAKESRAVLSIGIMSAPWHVTFRVMCQDPMGSHVCWTESQSAKSTPPAIRGPGS